MAEVRWTTQAADDIDAIAEFIAKDSPTYASLFASRVIDSAESLRDHPQIGRIVPELGVPAIRELIVGNYRIIHRTTADLVEILTVVHGARLIEQERFE